MNLKSDFAVGTYTGDGNATQAITGVGFQPTALLFGRYNSGSAEPQALSTTDLIAATFAISINAGTTLTTLLLSLDADGFTVKAAMNVNSGTYWWVALG